MKANSWMTTRTTLAITILAVTALCAPAGAEVMDFKGTGAGSSVRVQAPGMKTWTFAGQLQVEWQDETYNGYCVDLYQSAGDMTAEPMPVTELANGDMVAWLFDTYGTTATTGDEAAAVQVAMWELVTENSPHYNVGTGSFKVSGNSSVSDLADSYLDGLPDSYTPSPTMTVLASAFKQDILIGHVGSPVPEPGALATLAAGAGLVVFRRRRRRPAVA